MRTEIEEHKAALKRLRRSIDAALDMLDDERYVETAEEQKTTYDARYGRFDFVVGGFGVKEL